MQLVKSPYLDGVCLPFKQKNTHFQPHNLTLGRWFTLFVVNVAGTESKHRACCHDIFLSKPFRGLGEVLGHVDRL